MDRIGQVEEALRGISVLGEYLAVVEDEPPKEVGGILLPEVSLAAGTSGTVVALGRGLEGCGEGWAVGQRVWYRAYAGTRLKVRGEAVLLLDTTEVVARVGEGGEDLGAPPGYMLVEREEMPTTKGPIWLPAGYRHHTLSATAVVVSVGLFVDGFEAGDRVLLSANAGKGVEVGGRTLLRILPTQVLLRMPEGEGENEGSHMLRGYSPADLAEEPEAKVEEGDTAGLR